MVQRLTPTWEARATLTADPGRLDDVVREGGKRAAEVSGRTLGEVREAMKM